MRTRYPVYTLFWAILCMMILYHPSPVKAGKPISSRKSGMSFDGTSCPLKSFGETSIDVSPFSWMIKFYKRYVSPINGSRCPMYPSCSDFAAQVLSLEGERGIIMIFDRLIRCGRDLEDYTLVFQRGRVLHLDPVIKRLECKTNESSK